MAFMFTSGDKFKLAGGADSWCAAGAAALNNEEVKQQIMKKQSAHDYVSCPECGTRVIHESGCVTCPSCGWGICG